MRFWSLLFLFCSTLFLTGFGTPRLVDRAIAPTVGLSVGQLRNIDEASRPPNLSANALLLYDADMDRILFERNRELAVPPASLTKLMTAYLVLEQNDLESEVVIEQVDLVGGANMGLQVGERLTVEQLLWGLLIPSGNDAAMALARHTSGSAESFVQKMNRRAVELGLAQSRFANPHGLDAERHMSSATNLLALTRLLMGYPLFREIVGTDETVVAGHPLRSTNELLGLFEGINGVKTGTTERAGQCLVAGVERGGHQVYTVVLGSNDRYSDTRALYAFYEANYMRARGAPRALTVLNRLFKTNGEIWYLEADGPAPEELVRPWQLPSLWAYRRLQLPPEDQAWTAGMEVGVLEWRLGDWLIGTQRLILR